MSTNRDYTGLVRTPSSMAWLIKQRSKLKGQIDRLIAQQAAIPERLQALKQELAALDTVIPLHEVQVDPTIIKGRKPKGPSLAAHGSLTRFLLGRLREADGKPVYTTELALGFARANNLDMEKIRTPDLMDSVAKRLGVMAAEGDVRRHHPKATKSLGSWSLVRDEATD